MATSIFNSAYQTAQTWDMQGAAIVFSASRTSTGNASKSQRATSVTGALIVQSLSISFVRGVNKIYPINISEAIQLLGIPEGSMTMGIIWGPSNALADFIKQYKDDCMNTTATGKNGKSITIYPFGRKCGTATGNNMVGTLKVMSPAITGIGVTVQSAQGNAMPVNANMTLTFIDLQIDDGGAA